MLHNDILRRLRFALALNNGATIKLFALAECEMDPDYLQALMRKETETGFLPCRDKTLNQFLDGLIISKRGKQDSPSAPEQKHLKLSNNDILRKIKIAMSYRDTDMIEILKYANFRISKGELSALFRRPDHRSYKACGDQLLRNFLTGMVKKYRPDAS